MQRAQSCKYVFRDYSPGEENDILSLFTECFSGRRYGIDNWNWRFLRNPTERLCLVNLWNEKNELVAHTALSPQEAIINGKQQISAISCNTMAKQGIPALGMMVYQECYNRFGDIFTIGFPNRKAFPLTVRVMKHHYVGDVCFWTRKPTKCITDSDIQKISSFNSDVDYLYKAMAQTHCYICVRNSRYLNWRFIDSPREYNLYTLNKYNETYGYIVLNSYIEGREKHAQIVDIMANNEETFAKLLDHAVNWAFQNNCDLVKLWYTSNRYQSVLLQRRFSYGMQPFPIMLWNEVMPLSDMYITMADSDIF